MLRIAKIEDVPLHAIVVCASCETGVYRRARKEKKVEGHHFRRLKVRNEFHSLDDYHLGWCRECKGLLEFNSQILYIPSYWISDILEGKVTIGRRIMVFFDEQQVKQRGMRP